MKRGADKQLSKDDDQDDVVEDISTGFQMAKDAELAKREIRALPKRRSPAVAPVLPPASSITQPTSPQKFGGFSGFGSTGGATSPFTFATSSPFATTLKPADAPTISETASNATKKFASFLGPSSTAGPKPTVSSSSDTSKPDASGDTDEVALKYYTSLRGLNSSLLSAVSKAIESDPFVDVADLLDQYKKHRVSVQQDYDGKSSHVKTQSSASSLPSKSSASAPSFSLFKSATSAPAAMPAPPTSFAGFGASTAAGFAPKATSSTSQPSPFSFSSTTAASSDSKPASTLSSSPFSGFTGASSSSSQFKPATSLATNESASFPFGGGGSGATSTLLFSNPPKTASLFGSTSEEKDKEKDKPASSAPAPFAFNLAPGSNLFGDTTTGGSSSIFGAATTKSASDKEKKGQAELLPPLQQPGSAFGGPPTKPFGLPTKSSPFTFGGAAAASTTTTTTTSPASFGFGVAPGGSSERSTPPKAGSVGFSFGSPSTTTTSAAAPGSGLLFGFPSTTSTSTSAAGAAGAGGTGGGGASTAGSESTPASTNDSTPAPAPAAASTPGHLDVPSRGDTPATEGSQEEDGLSRLTPGLHGGEGEGEEDEETTYTAKAKVFRFSTDREGAPTWFEMGIGLLRLKKHTETNARRVILRSTTTGKIVINFRIYPGLQPKRSGKTVAFTGHITSPGKDTQTAQYRLRVANEAAAAEMTEAIEREVRLVQADSGPSS